MALPDQFFASADSAGAVERAAATLDSAAVPFRLPAGRATQASVLAKPAGTPVFDIGSDPLVGASGEPVAAL